MCGMVLKIAHVSDTHLGYEAYAARSPSGNNQRGEDVVRAFRDVVEDILSWDPHIVIHSGDVLDRPKPDLRYMVAAKNYLARLAGTPRGDGSVRQVVVIAGNHDLPRSRKEACWLDLLTDLPGLHIATNRLMRFRFDGDLAGVVVHAIPHDTLKEIDQAGVEPVEGAVNILTTHGTAAGSELFRRAVGREYPVEEGLLLKPWDYVALGHWHKQGPVTFGSVGRSPRIWYAGSTENMGFGDVVDGGGDRGYLRVELDGSGVAVRPVPVPIRPMFRLPVVDATGLTPDEIVDALIDNLSKADVHGAVVGQIVEGAPREIWGLVDLGAVRKHAEGALHYEAVLRSTHEDRAKRDVLDTEFDPSRIKELIAAHLAQVPPKLRDKVASNVEALVAAQIDAAGMAAPDAEGEAAR